MRRLLAFVRWSRDAGWEASWSVISYPFRTWRCRIFGHKWGPEFTDYEPNCFARMSSWRDCERPGCVGLWETWNYAEPDDWAGRVLG